MFVRACARCSAEVPVLEGQEVAGPFATGQGRPDQASGHQRTLGRVGGGIGLRSGAAAVALQRLVLDVPGEHDRHGERHGEDDHQEQRRRARADAGGDRPAPGDHQRRAEGERRREQHEVDGPRGGGAVRHSGDRHPDQAGGEPGTAPPAGRPAERTEPEQRHPGQAEDEERAPFVRLVDRQRALGEGRQGQDEEATDQEAACGPIPSEQVPADGQNEAGDRHEEQRDLSGELEEGGGGGHAMARASTDSCIHRHPGPST